MKNVLAIINGVHAPIDVLEFGLHAVKTNEAYFKGIVIKRLPDSTIPQYPFPNDLSFMETEEEKKQAAEETHSVLQNNLKMFRDECEAAGIKYKIAHEAEISFDELITESLFADMMIADERAVFLDYTIEELLSKSNCPVCLVTNGVQETKKIILTYNGTPSSIYAIKQFAYLFPQWGHIPVEVVSAIKEGGNIDFEAEFNSWLHCHFNHININILHGSAEDVLIPHLQKQTEDTLVVMGSFGRSAVSRFFSDSIANKVINDTRASLFIAHK